MYLKFQGLSKKEPEKLERLLFASGACRIAGVDEAGRGPLAGPVVACACILPENCTIEVHDSKMLSEKERKRIYQELLSTEGVSYALSVIDHEEIDSINILQATMKAMSLAVSSLVIKPDIILVDGNQTPPFDIPSITVVKGDAFCRSISAASIIAKVERDHMMCSFHKKWPHWGFDVHKGYGTKMHISRIQEFGISPIHRKTFEPVRSLVSSQSKVLKDIRPREA